MYRPKRKYKTCSDYIIEEHEVDNNYSHFAITLFRNTEKEVTLSGEQIAGTLLHDFGNFFAFSCETVVDFMYEYTRFVQLHTHDFERIYRALYTDYEPLENYDKHSTISNEGSAGAKSDDKPTVYGYQVADDTVNATGDNAFIPRDKSITSGTTETSNTMTEHTHGNIGVTQSADMARNEIMLRVQHNMINTICNMFAEMELI